MLTGDNSVDAAEIGLYNHEQHSNILTPVVLRSWCFVGCMRQLVCVVGYRYLEIPTIPNID